MATDDLLAQVPHAVQFIVDSGLGGTADLVEELAAEIRALRAQLAEDKATCDELAAQRTRTLAGRSPLLGNPFGDLMNMTRDPMRELDIERVGIVPTCVMSDGHRCVVEMRREDFDRLVRLAASTRAYWHSGSSLVDEDVA